ncbi:KGG domain-containing protein [Priestia megaterium]
MGEKGGKATSKNQNKEFFREIGEKGGKASNKNSNS